MDRQTRSCFTTEVFDNTATQMLDETPEKKSVIAWIKEHKVELLFAGISITAVLLTLLGLKNKDAVKELWTSLKVKIEKGALYSDKWFSKASLEELVAAREIVQADYGNPNLEDTYRDECWYLLHRFDSAIRNIKTQGKEVGFPVHSEHGWHLPSDD